MRNVLFALLLLGCGISGFARTVHWIEAEDYKGNAVVKEMPDASGGKALTGNTWYEFIKNMPAPIPEDGSLHCFIRMQSDVPANWFLCYQTNKVERWLKTSGGNRWEWVNAGQWKLAHLKDKSGNFPRLFLQNPQQKGQGLARGAVDAIVFTDINDPAELDRLLQERLNAGVSSKTAQVAQPQDPMRRVFFCPELASDPVLDGALDDPAWESAARLTDFALLRTAVAASQPTTVRVGRRGDWLFIGAELEESAMPFLRKLQKSDGDSVWTDDTFEMFFDPGLTQRKAHQLVVNPNAAKFDTLKSRLDEPDFAEVTQRKWKAAAKQNRDRWSVEIAIPWRLLAAEVPGGETVWGVNFCRNEVPAREQSSWSGSGDIFNQPDRFGLMFFKPLPDGFAGIRFDSGKGTLEYCFDGKVDGGFSLTAQLFRDGTKIWEKTQSSSAPFSLGALKSGRYRLESRIADASGKSVEFPLELKVFSDGLVSTAYPQADRENTLFLMDGVAGHSFFIPANHGKEKLEALRLHLVVPDGIRVLPPHRSVNSSRYIEVAAMRSRPVQMEGRAMTEYTLDLKGALPPCRIKDRTFYQSVLLFLKAQNPALTGKELTGEYFFSAGKQEEERNSFRISVLPRSEGKQPRQLAIHNWLWTYNPYDGETADEFIAAQRIAGFNGVDADGTVEMEQYQKLFRENGLRPVNNFHYYWYSPERLKAHPEEGALNFKGERSKANLCPTLLLADEGKLLLESCPQIFDRVSQGKSFGTIWDLEGPHVFDLCFCPRCIASFAEQNQLSGASLTPELIRQKHAEAWTAFACRQSAEMCRVIQAELKRRNPEAVLGLYCGLPNAATRENYRVDWKQTMPYLDLALLSYYSNSPAMLDETFGGRMRETIRSIREMAGKRPVKVWATLTPGYGPNSAMAPSAELVKLQILASFAAGADGVSFWWWGPFDGKYYREMAEASRIAADFEPWLLAGNQPDAVSVRHPYGKRISVFASKRDGKTFVMILNHQTTTADKIALTVPQATGLTSYQGDWTIDGNQAALTLPPLSCAVLVGRE